jgi:hypothetical protein
LFSGVEAKRGDAVQKPGIKVGGFLRQDFAAMRTTFFDVHGIYQKRDLRAESTAAMAADASRS